MIGNECHYLKLLNPKLAMVQVIVFLSSTRLGNLEFKYRSSLPIILKCHKLIFNCC